MSEPGQTAEIARLRALVAALHKGVCAGYAATLDRLRAVERENIALKEQLENPTKRTAGDSAHDLRR